MTLEKLSLGNLRRWLGVSQNKLARALDWNQPEVSRLEARIAAGEDVKWSTLRNYLEALGGRPVVRVWVGEEVYELELPGEVRQ